MRKSKTLTRKAQDWADKLLREGKYEIADVPNVGQSIAYKFQRSIEKGLPDGRDITNQWYNEKIHYNYDREQHCKGAGHFTQMIWKGTKFIGVGIAWDIRGGKVVIGKSLTMAIFNG